MNDENNKDSKNKRFSKLEMTAPEYKVDKKQFKRKLNIKNSKLNEIKNKEKKNEEDFIEIDKTKEINIKDQENLQSKIIDKKRVAIDMHNQSKLKSNANKDTFYDQADDEYKKVMRERQRVMNELNNMDQNEGYQLDIQSAILKIVAGIVLIFIGISSITEVSIGDFFPILCVIFFTIAFVIFIRNILK
jgi:hypothetical protein